MIKQYASVMGLFLLGKLPEVSDLTPQAQVIIEWHTRDDGLNEKSLGQSLLNKLPGDSVLVNVVFDTMDLVDRDDVSYYIASQASDKQIAAIGADPGGRAVLWRMIRELQDGTTDDEDAVQIERIVRLTSPTHAHLREEPWASNPHVKSALVAAGASIQSSSSGEGDYIYDSYEITIDKMPANLTPEAYIEEMANDLTPAVNSPAFDMLTTFVRRSAGAPPAVGDLYDIDIVGPDNGTVMIVEIATDHFTVQTVTTPFSETGEHPECGARQFGFERNKDGSVTFYTRGASRPLALLGPDEVTGGFIAYMQGDAWRNLLSGIGAELGRRGAKWSLAGIRWWTTHRFRVKR